MEHKLYFCLILFSSVFCTGYENCLAYGIANEQKLCFICLNSIVNTNEAGCLDMPEEYNCVSTDYYGPDVNCSYCKPNYANNFGAKELSKQCTPVENPIDNCLAHFAKESSSGCMACSNSTIPSKNFDFCEASTDFPNCEAVWRQEDELTCFICKKGFSLNYQGKCDPATVEGCFVANDAGDCTLCDGWHGYYMSRFGTNCEEKSGIKELPKNTDYAIGLGKKMREVIRSIRSFE